MAVHHRDKKAYLNPAAKDARARQAVALGDAKTLRNYLEESQHRDGVGAAGVVGGRSAWRLRLLHLAVFEGSVDTVLLLLSAGASPNAQDLDGWTTLHYAARNETGGEVLVRTLLVAGAEADKTTNRGRTALHIAYLSRNSPAVSELLEHGASTVVRDTLGKTPPQMLELSKPVRRRPWSGSSAIPGGSQELSACRRGRPCPDRPRTAAGDRSGSTHNRITLTASREARRSPVGAARDRPSTYEEGTIAAGDSFSTLQRSSIVNVNDDSALTVIAGRGTVSPDGRGTDEAADSNDLGQCWRCHREMAILERRHDSSRIIGGSTTDTGDAFPVPDGGGGGGSGDRGESSFDDPCTEGNERDHPSGVWGGGSSGSSGTECGGEMGVDRYRAGLARQQSTLLSPGADTRLDEFSAFGVLEPSNESGEPNRVTVGDSARTNGADWMGPSPKEEEESMSLELSHSHVCRHNGEEEEDEDIEEGVTEALKRERSGSHRTSYLVGMQRGSPTQGMRRRRRSGRRGGGRKRGGVKAPRGMSLAGPGRRHGRAKGGVSDGGGVPGRRRFFHREDQVPEYVVGRRRMLWAQRSAARYARRTDNVERRREEIASPRRLKVAAAVEEEKRRMEEELKRKERVGNSPLRWGRDGRPQGSPVRPSSSPAVFPGSPNSPTSTVGSLSASPSCRHQRRPSSAGPYGGRSCIKCDPRWWFRGEFVGELAGPGRLEGKKRVGQRDVGRGDADGGDGGLWNMAVTDRYRVLRLWVRIPHEDSELWWAKPRMDKNGKAVVVKVSTEGSATEESWKDFVREWGVLKYLQEEGRLDGREPLCVGLAGAFAKERVLVLSIPAGSRTLREVGQELHSGRRRKKKPISDEAFFEQVESLAVQACRAICWLHRCGLISGDANPSGFVFLGSITGGGNTDCALGRARGGDSDGTLIRGDGAFGRGSAGVGSCEGGLRLATGRSVARRSDAAGGCPIHPLLEPVDQTFPPGKPFEEAYATPERVRAAAYDVPFPAEVAEDAWGLGMTIYWLLTGQENFVHDAPLRAMGGEGDIVNGSGSVTPADLDKRKPSRRKNKRPACPGKVCSALPDLLSPEPRKRETALALAGRHVKLLQTRHARSPSRTRPRLGPDAGNSTQRKWLPAGKRLAPRAPISPGRHRAAPTASTSVSVTSPPPRLRSRGDPETAASEEIAATTQEGDRAAPSSGESIVGERCSDTPGGGATLAEASVDPADGGSKRCPSLKSVGVGKSPTTKRTGSATCTSPTASEKSNADAPKVVRKGTSPGTSPRMTVTLGGGRRIRPRTPSPESPRAAKVLHQPCDVSSPEVSSPAEQSGTPKRRHDTHGSSNGNGPLAAEATGDGVFGDTEAKPDAALANDGFEATLVVSPAGEAGSGANGRDWDAIGGDDLEKTLVGYHAGNGGLTRQRAGEPACDGMDRRSGERDDGRRQNSPHGESQQTTYVDDASKGHSVVSDNAGHPPRKKKKNRVAPIGLGQTEASVTGGEGAEDGRGKGDEVQEQSSNVQSGGHPDPTEGQTTHAVAAKKKSVDAGVQYVRPPEASGGRAKAEAGGNCGCSVM